MKRGALAAAFLAGAYLLAPLAALTAIKGGDVEYKPKDAGKVVFKHDYHMNLKVHTCNNCHFKTFSMGGPSYHMDKSVLTKGAFCGKCHDGNKAFDVKDANGCGRCHKKK